MNSQSDDKRFWLEMLFIFLYFCVEQIDARYFIPKMKEMSLDSSVKCHDDLNQCWMKQKTKKEAAK